MAETRPKILRGAPRAGFANLVDRIRRVPWEAVAVGLGLFAVLALFVGADPSAAGTASTSPFTDEAYNVVNARNLIQLGRWSVDPWNLYLVNLPFSVLIAAGFKLLGVGMIQARLVTIACVSLASAALAWGLRGVVGRVPAIVAGVAFATSGLILFYGRLAYLEDLVVLGLTLGFLVLARTDRLTFRWGLVAGVCFAIAIGTKPNAAFPVAGILFALAVFQRKGTWRWIVGCLAVIALAGTAWAVFVWLPNRAAVSIDLQIWPQNTLPRNPIQWVVQALAYPVRSDGVVGWMLGPLLALAGAAVAAIIGLRKRLTAAEGRLALASLGWLVFSFGILLVVTYRPNRYVIQDVPALAVLVAVALSAVRRWLDERAAALNEVTPDAAPEAPTAGQRRLRFSTANLLVIAAVVFVSAPGIVQYASWMNGATYSLPQIENQFANTVPDGQTVAGYPAALFFMKSYAIAITTGALNPALENADLYATGVRWYLQAQSDPAPIGVPASAWSARQTMTCAVWRGYTSCLFKVP